MPLQVSPQHPIKPFLATSPNGFHSLADVAVFAGGNGLPRVQLLRVKTLNLPQRHPFEFGGSNVVVGGELSGDGAPGDAPLSVDAPVIAGAREFPRDPPSLASKATFSPSFIAQR